MMTCTSVIVDEPDVSHASHAILPSNVTHTITLRYMNTNFNKLCAHRDSTGRVKVLHLTPSQTERKLKLNRTKRLTEAKHKHTKLFRFKVTC